MAAKMQIATLTLERFRGASQKVDISFSDKPITLLFGENGTGKSSIIDGLEFVLKGSAGSISEISGASTSSHLPSLNSKAEDVAAEVKLGDGSVFSSQLDGRKIVQITTGPSARPNAVFLRRSMILALVTAQPQKRYRELASFIEVSGVENAEQSLKESIAKETIRLDSASKQVTNNSEELIRLFNDHAGGDEKDLGYEQWAAKQAAEDISDLKMAVESLRNAIKCHDSANRELTEANDLQTLPKEKREEQKGAQSEFETAIKNAPGAVDLLLDLYAAGRAYIDEVERIENCPLCTNLTSRSQIAAEIESKLEALPGVKAAKKARDDANVAVKQETENSLNAYVRLLRSAHSLLASVEQVDEDRRQGLNPDSPLLSPIKGLPDAVSKEHVTKESIAAAEKLLAQTSAAHSLWKEVHASLEAQRILFSSIQTHHEALMKGRKNAEVFQKVKEHLQNMLDTVRSTRQEFVQEILSSVASDCDRLYEAIHPDEPLGGIRLTLDAGKRSSCEIDAEFCGKKGIPPQAYYSESHMDTLGFALFLALAKRGATRNTIVVLDDIFTSVDDQHLRRICDLLADEAGHFRQIIISTHLRKILDWVRSGALPQKVYGPVRLSSKWSLDEGIRTQFATVQRTEIQDLMKADFTERIELAGKTRHFLESLIGPIVIELRGSAPMKQFGDYELSDYLTALRSLTKDGWRIRRAQDSPGILRARHPRESYDLRAKAKEFNDDKNVVNKLVHADERGAAYTNQELLDFASEALKLEGYLRCDDANCGSLIGSKKKFMTCNCGAWKWDKVPKVNPS